LLAKSGWILNTILKLVLKKQVAQNCKNLMIIRSYSPIIIWRRGYRTEIPGRNQRALKKLARKYKNYTKRERISWKERYN